MPASIRGNAQLLIYSLMAAMMLVGFVELFSDDGNSSRELDGLQDLPPQKGVFSTGFGWVWGNFRERVAQSTPRPRSTHQPERQRPPRRQLGRQPRHRRAHGGKGDPEEAVDAHVWLPPASPGRGLCKRKGDEGHVRTNATLRPIPCILIWQQR